MLFNGLMMQSEINYLLDELFGDLEGDSLGKAEGMGLTSYEAGERENAHNAMLLTA